LRAQAGPSIHCHGGNLRQIAWELPSSALAFHFVIDTPSLQNRIPVVDDAADAVVFMEVDADIKRSAWLVCSLAHRLSFYTIDYSRFRSSKRLQSKVAKGFYVI
jgi:hypothetical protein